MKNRSHIVAGLLLMLFVASGWAHLNLTNTYRVSDLTQMWVEGTSTIHDWECSVGRVDGIIGMDPDPVNNLAIVSTQITVPVSSLDCDNKTMNKKLAKALKLDSNPSILFELETATRSGVGSDLSDQIEAQGFLMIAGQTRRITLSGITASSDGDRMSFSGSAEILMSDFNIKAPTALLGTIKTGDKVTVHFELVLSEDNVSS